MRKSRGFIQFLPLILLAVFTGIMVIIIGFRAQQANVAEIRSKAVGDCGVYPCPPTPPTTSTPIPAKTPTPIPTTPATTPCPVIKLNTAGTCPDGKTIKYVWQNADCKQSTDVCPGIPTTTPKPIQTTSLVPTALVTIISPVPTIPPCAKCLATGTAFSCASICAANPLPTKTPTLTPFQFKDAAVIQKQYLGLVGNKVDCGVSGTIAIGPANEIYGCGADGKFINLTKKGVGPEYLTPGNRPVWLEGSTTFQIATAKGQTAAQAAAEYIATVNQYTALGLPTPTPAKPGTPCGGGEGGSLVSSGSVIIGPVVNGKDSTLQCGNDGLLKQCDNCLLTSIPSYLLDPAAYKVKFLKDAGESAAFDAAYKQCTASSGDRAACEQQAVQVVSNARAQTALEQYTQALDTCNLINDNNDKCLTKASATLAGKGLTTDQISKIPQQYTVNAKIQERYTQNYQPALEKYLNGTADEQSAITACQSMGKTQVECQTMVSNAKTQQVAYQNDYLPVLDTFKKCSSNCNTLQEEAVAACIKLGSGTAAEAAQCKQEVVDARQQYIQTQNLTIILTAINSNDPQQIIAACLKIEQSSMAVMETTKLSCATADAATALLNTAATSLQKALPTTITGQIATVTQTNGTTVKLLPGEAGCKGAGQCVANNNGAIQSVTNATDAYALSCPSGCALVGAGSGQRNIAASLFNPAKVNKCSADGGGVDTYFTQASFNHRDISQPASSSRCGSEICVAGACVDGTVIKNNQTGTYQIVTANQKLTQADPVTGTTIQYQVVVQGTGANRTYNLVPYFASDTAKNQYVAQYTNMADAYAKANFAPSVVTAYETYKAKNPDAPFIENFQSQQRQQAQSLKTQVFIGQNDPWWNIPMRIIHGVQSALTTTQQVQTVQALFTSDPTWVDRGIASGQLDVGSLEQEVKALQNKYTSQQLATCAGAQSLEQRQNCQAMNKSAQLQEEYTQTFYTAYLSTLSTDQQKTYNTAFAASDIGKQCASTGTSQSDCQMQNFKNFLLVSKDVNYLMTSGGSTEQTSIASALNGGMDYAYVTQILSDPLTKLALQVNAHTNGNFVQGKLRTDDANQKWQSGDHSAATWWEGTSGRIQSTAQLFGEGVAIGTGIGGLVNVGAEGLTAKAVLSLGSTVLSEKMAGDSLAQTATNCYNIQSGDQRLACVQSGAMTFLALGSAVQGATQLAMLSREAAMARDVASAAKLAVTQGTEDAAAANALGNATEKAAETITTPATNGWVKAMNSQVFNRALGAAGTVTFGISAGEACSQGKADQCTLNLAMASMSFFRMVAPANFASTPQAKSLEVADKVVNTGYAASACAPALLGGPVDQNCLMALTFAGMSLAPHGAPPDTKLAGEGPEAQLAEYSKQAKAYAGAADYETVKINGEDVTITPQLRTKLEQNLASAELTVAGAKAKVNMVPDPPTDFAKRNIFQDEVAASKTNLKTLENQATPADPEALDAARQWVIDAGGALVAYKASLDSGVSFIDRLIRGKDIGTDLTGLQKLQDDLTTFVNDKAVNPDVITNPDAKLKFDAGVQSRMDEISAVKDTIASKLNTATQNTFLTNVHTALDDLSQKANDLQRYQDELVHINNPDRFTEQLTEQSRTVKQLQMEVTDLTARGVDPQVIDTVNTRLKLAQERFDAMVEIKNVPERPEEQVLADLTAKQTAYDESLQALLQRQTELARSKTLIGRFQDIATIETKIAGDFSKQAAKTITAAKPAETAQGGIRKAWQSLLDNTVNKWQEARVAQQTTQVVEVMRMVDSGDARITIADNKVVVNETLSRQAQKTITEINKFLDTFATETGLTPDAEQTKIILRALTEQNSQALEDLVLVRNAGGGKTSVVHRLVAGFNAKVLGKISFHSMPTNGATLDFYNSLTNKAKVGNFLEGVTIVGYDTQTGFSDITKTGTLDKGTPLSAQEVKDLAANASRTGKGFIITTSIDQTAWGELTGKYVEGVDHAKVFVDLFGNTGLLNHMVDEPQAIIGKNWSVPIDPPKKIALMNDPNAFGGVVGKTQNQTVGERVIEISDEVRKSPSAREFAQKYNDAVSNSKDVTTLFTEDGKVNRPADTKLFRKSFADLVDQQIASLSDTPENQVARTAFSDLRAKYDTTPDMFVAEYDAFRLSKTEDSVLQNAMNELNLRQYALQRFWDVHELVPGNTLGLGADGKTISLFFRGAETGEVYQDAVGRIMLQNEGPEMLKSAGVVVDPVKLYTPDELTVSGRSVAISGAELLTSRATQMTTATPLSTMKILGVAGYGAEAPMPESPVRLYVSQESKVAVKAMLDNLSPDELSQTQVIVNGDDKVAYRKTTQNIVDELRAKITDPAKQPKLLAIIDGQGFRLAEIGADGTLNFVKQANGQELFTDGTTWQEQFTKFDTRTVKGEEYQVPVGLEYKGRTLNPSELVVVFEGRIEQVDILPLSDAHWAGIANDSMTAENLEQLIKRNRAWARTIDDVTIKRELASRGYKKSEIQALIDTKSYDLILRVNDETQFKGIIADNVVDNVFIPAQEQFIREQITHNTIAGASTMTRDLMNKVENYVATTVDPAKRAEAVNYVRNGLVELQRTAQIQLSRMNENPENGATVLYRTVASEQAKLTQFIVDAATRYGIDPAELTQTLGVKGLISEREFISTLKLPVESKPAITDTAPGNYDAYLRKIASTRQYEDFMDRYFAGPRSSDYKMVSRWNETFAKAMENAPITTVDEIVTPVKFNLLKPGTWPIIGSLFQPKFEQVVGDVSLSTSAGRDQAIAAARVSNASSQTIITALAAAQLNADTAAKNMFSYLPFGPAHTNLTNARETEAVMRAAALEDVNTRIAKAFSIDISAARDPAFTSIRNQMLAWEVAKVSGSQEENMRTVALQDIRAYVENNLSPAQQKAVDYDKLFASLEMTIPKGTITKPSIPAPVVVPPVATTKEAIIADATAATKKLLIRPVNGNDLRLPVLAGLVAAENDSTLVTPQQKTDMDKAYVNDVTYRLAIALLGNPDMPKIQSAPGGTNAIQEIMDWEKDVALGVKDTNDPSRNQVLQSIAALAPQVGVTLGTTAGSKTADTVLNTVSTTLIDAWRGQHTVSPAAPQVSTKGIREYIRTIGAKIIAWWQIVRTKPVATTISDGLATAWAKIKSINISGIKFAPFEKLTEDEMKAAMQIRRWRTDGLWAMVNATPRDHTVWWLVRGAGGLPFKGINPFFLWDAVRIATTRGGWQMYWSQHPAVASAAPRGTPLTAPQAQIIQTSNQWKTDGFLKSLWNASPTRNPTQWWLTRGGVSTVTFYGLLNPFVWHDISRVARAPGGWKQGWQLFTRRLPTAEEPPSAPTTKPPAPGEPEVITPVLTDTKGNEIQVGKNIIVVQKNGTVVSGMVSTIGTTPVRGDYLELPQKDGRPFRIYTSSVDSTSIIDTQWTDPKVAAFTLYRAKVVEAQAQGISLTGDLAVLTLDGTENANDVKSVTTRLQEAIDGIIAKDEVAQEKAAADAKAQADATAARLSAEAKAAADVQAAADALAVKQAEAARLAAAQQPPAPAKPVTPPSVQTNPVLQQAIASAADIASQIALLESQKGTLENVIQSLSDQAQALEKQPNAQLTENYQTLSDQLTEARDTLDQIDESIISLQKNKLLKQPVNWRQTQPTVYRKNVDNTLRTYRVDPSSLSPISLKLGAIDSIHPFQQQLIELALLGDTKGLDRYVKQVQQQAENDDIEIHVFDTRKEYSNYVSSWLGLGEGDDNVGLSGSVKVNGVPVIGPHGKPLRRVVLLSPKGYAAEYGRGQSRVLSEAEGWSIFVQKLGHEVGHAYDKRANASVTSRETEARQKYFNAYYYVITGQFDLAEDYFAISFGLAGYPDYKSRAVDYTNTLREKLSNFASIGQYQLSNGTTVGRDYRELPLHWDSSVSRAHAQLSIGQENDSVTISDLKSTNGTYLNGKKITSASLSVGDVITIGNNWFIYNGIKSGQMVLNKVPRELANVYIQRNKQSAIVAQLKSDLDVLEAQKALTGATNKLQVDLDAKNSVLKTNQQNLDTLNGKLNGLNTDQTKIAREIKSLSTILPQWDALKKSLQTGDAGKITKAVANLTSKSTPVLLKAGIDVVTLFKESVKDISDVTVLIVLHDSLQTAVLPAYQSVSKGAEVSRIIRNVGTKINKIQISSIPAVPAEIKPETPAKAVQQPEPGWVTQLRNQLVGTAQLLLSPVAELPIVSEIGGVLSRVRELAGFGGTVDKTNISPLTQEALLRQEAAKQQAAALRRAKSLYKKQYAAVVSELFGPESTIIDAFISGASQEAIMSQITAAFDAHGITTDLLINAGEEKSQAALIGEQYTLLKSLYEDLRNAHTTTNTLAEQIVARETEYFAELTLGLDLESAQFILDSLPRTISPGFLTRLENDITQRSTENDAFNRGMAAIATVARAQKKQNAQENAAFNRGMEVISEIATLMQNAQDAEVFDRGMAVIATVAEEQQKQNEEEAAAFNRGMAAIATIARAQKKQTIQQQQAADFNRGMATIAMIAKLQQTAEFRDALDRGLLAISQVAGLQQKQNDEEAAAFNRGMDAISQIAQLQDAQDQADAFNRGMAAIATIARAQKNRIAGHVDDALNALGITTIRQQVIDAFTAALSNETNIQLVKAGKQRALRSVFDVDQFHAIIDGSTVTDQQFIMFLDVLSKGLYDEIALTQHIVKPTAKRSPAPPGAKTVKSATSGVKKATTAQIISIAESAIDGDALQSAYIESAPKFRAYIKSILPDHLEAVGAMQEQLLAKYIFQPTNGLQNVPMGALPSTANNLVVGPDGRVPVKVQYARGGDIDIAIEPGKLATLAIDIHLSPLDVVTIPVKTQAGNTPVQVVLLRRGGKTIDNEFYPSLWQEVSAGDLPKLLVAPEEAKIVSTTESFGATVRQVLQAWWHDQQVAHIVPPSVSQLVNSGFGGTEMSMFAYDVYELLPDETPYAIRKLDSLATAFSSWLQKQQDSKGKPIRTYAQAREFLRTRPVPVAQLVADMKLTDSRLEDEATKIVQAVVLITGTVPQRSWDFSMINPIRRTIGELSNTGTDVSSDVLTLRSLVEQPQQGKTIENSEYMQIILSYLDAYQPYELKYQLQNNVPLAEGIWKVVAAAILQTLPPVQPIETIHISPQEQQPQAQPVAQQLLLAGEQSLVISVLPSLAAWQDVVAARQQIEQLRLNITNARLSLLSLYQNALRTWNQPATVPEPAPQTTNLLTMETLTEFAANPMVSQGISNAISTSLVHTVWDFSTEKGRSALQQNIQQTIANTLLNQNDVANDSRFTPRGIDTTVLTAYTETKAEEIMRDLALWLDGKQGAITLIDDAARQSRETDRSFTSWNRVKELVDPDNSKTFAPRGLLTSTALQHLAESIFQTDLKTYIADLRSQIQKQRTDNKQMTDIVINWPKGNYGVYKQELQEIYKSITAISKKTLVLGPEERDIQRAVWVVENKPSITIEPVANQKKPEFTVLLDGKTTQILVNAGWETVGKTSGIVGRVVLVNNRYQAEFAETTPDGKLSLGIIRLESPKTYGFEKPEQAIAKADGKPVKTQQPAWKRIVLSGALLTVALPFTSAFIFLWNNFFSIKALPPLTTPTVQVSTMSPSSTVTDTGPLSTQTPTDSATMDANAQYAAEFAQSPSYMNVVTKSYFTENIVPARRAWLSDPNNQVRLYGRTLTDSELEKQIQSPILHFVIGGTDLGNIDQYYYGWAQTRADLILDVYINRETGSVSVFNTNRDFILADGYDVNGNGNYINTTPFSLEQKTALPGVQETDFVNSPLLNMKMRFEAYSGVPVDDVTLVSFDGFIDAISYLYGDTGITLNVPFEWAQYDEYGGVKLNPPGQYTFTRGKLLDFIRFRKYQEGDTATRDLKIQLVMDQMIKDMAKRYGVGIATGQTSITDLFNQLEVVVDRLKSINGMISSMDWFSGDPTDNLEEVHDPVQGFLGWAEYEDLRARSIVGPVAYGNKVLQFAQSVIKGDAINMYRVEPIPKGGSKQIVGNTYYALYAFGTKFVGPDYPDNCVDSLCHGSWNTGEWEPNLVDHQGEMQNAIDYYQFYRDFIGDRIPGYVPISGIQTGPSVSTAPLAPSISSVAPTTNAPLNSRPLRIMPLGDSQISGGSIPYYLFTGLQSGTIPTVLVGSQTVASPVGGDPIHMEGHGGFGTDLVLQQLLKGTWTNRDGSEYPVNITAENAPDVLIIQLGSNDITNGNTRDHYWYNIEQIIAYFRAVNPNVTVFLAPIPPQANVSDTVTQKIADFNNTLMLIARADSTDTSKIVYFGGEDIQISDILPDGIHMNEMGSQKIANAMLRPLQTVLPGIYDRIKNEQAMVVGKVNPAPRLSRIQQLTSAFRQQAQYFANDWPTYARKERTRLYNAQDDVRQSNYLRYAYRGENYQSVQEEEGKFSTQFTLWKNQVIHTLPAAFINYWWSRLQSLDLTLRVGTAAVLNPFINSATIRWNPTLHRVEITVSRSTVSNWQQIQSGLLNVWNRMKTAFPGKPGEIRTYESSVQTPGTFKTVGRNYLGEARTWIQTWTDAVRNRMRRSWSTWQQSREINRLLGTFKAQVKGDLQKGQVFENNGAYYRVIQTPDNQMSLIRVLPMHFTIPEYQQTIGTYVKKDSPQTIKLANNFKVLFWWNDAEDTLLMKPETSTQEVVLTDQPVTFTNGLKILLDADKRIQADWFTNEIELDAGQTVYVAFDGSVTFVNQAVTIGKDTRFPKFQINGEFFAEQAMQKPIQPGDHIITATGEQYSLVAGTDGYYQLNKENGASETKKTQDFIKSYTDRFSEDAGIRQQFLRYTATYLRLSVSDAVLLEKSSEIGVFLTYLQEILQLADKPYIQGMESFRISQNPSNSGTKDTAKLNFLLFHYLADTYPDFSSYMEKIYTAYPERQLDRLRFGANAIRFYGEHGGLSELGEITYLKNLEKIISLYESYTKMSSDEFTKTVRTTLADFDPELQNAVFTRLEQLKQYNPFDQKTYIVNGGYDNPFAPFMNNDWLVSVCEQEIEGFMTQRLFRQVTDEAGIDAFTKHRQDMQAFWDTAFQKASTERPSWFTPYLYAEKETYDYTWQYVTQENILANAAGMFFLRQSLSMDTKGFEEVINHEAVHQTYLPEKSTPRKSRSPAFIHEEVLTELLAQMITDKSSEIPPKDQGFSMYQTGVNELIDIANDIDTKSGPGSAFTAIVRGMADYGNNLIDHPLVYLAQSYAWARGTTEAEFYTRMAPFTDDIMRSDPTNLAEDATFVEGGRTTTQVAQITTQLPAIVQGVVDHTSAFIAAQADAAGVTDATQIQQIQTLVTTIAPQVTSGKLTYDEVISYLDGKSTADIQKTALLTQLFETGPPSLRSFGEVNPPKESQQTLLRHALEYLQSKIVQPHIIETVQHLKPVGTVGTKQEMPPFLKFILADFPAYVGAAIYGFWENVRAMDFLPPNGVEIHVNTALGSGNIVRATSGIQKLFDQNTGDGTIVALVFYATEGVLFLVDYFAKKLGKKGINPKIRLVSSVATGILTAAYLETTKFMGNTIDIPGDLFGVFLAASVILTFKVIGDLIIKLIIKYTK